MASVKLEVSIDGSPVSPLVRVLSLQLGMSLARHHRGKIHLCSIDSKEVCEGRSSHLEELFKQLGKVLTLRIVPTEEKLASRTVRFSGVIIESSHFREYDGRHTLILNLASPTFLLDGGARCRIWEKKDPRTIALAILKPYDLLRYQVDEIPSQPRIEYEAQFEETDFQFLRRLAGRAGLWLYYDGEKLRAAKKPKAEGKDHLIRVFRGEKKAFFERLAVRTQVRQGRFQHTHFLPHEKEDHAGDHAQGAQTGLGHAYAELARQQGLDIFPQQAHTRLLAEPPDEESLREQATVLAHSLMGTLVFLDGVTNHPGLVPGAWVTIEGGEGPEDGEYLVESADHSFMWQEGYRAQVRLIPRSCAYPPAPPHAVATALQRAIVVGKYDTEHPGMIKVRYSRAVDGETDEGTNDAGQAVTTFVRVAMPHGGEQAGFVSLPEIDDEVVLGHVGGRATHPVILGSLYSRKKKSKAFAEIQAEIPKNDGKVFLTKSGNVMVFRDVAGKETIEMRSPKGKNLLKLTLDGGPQVIVETQGDVRIKAKDQVEVEADGDIKVKAKGKITMESGKDFEIKTQSNLKAEAVQEVKIHGMTFKAEGTNQAQVVGTQSELKGQSLVVVQAPLVKIN